MANTQAFGVTTAGARLAPMTIERRDPGPHDVAIDVLFTGVCHSDLHQARDEWGGGIFPMVPGHEIVGRVSAVGAKVTKVKVGDMAGVGCMVDSCGTCESCKSGSEQFCERGSALTYNSTEMDRKTRTYGGYSTQVVVTERFVLRFPEGLDPAAGAPLLCAGITTYSPLREWNCKSGDRVAVMGLGGLGHMAIKLAASMGAEVTVLSTSKNKQADAERLGAKDFAVVRDADSLRPLARRFDLVIDTVSAEHEVGAYLGTLRPHGALVMVGAPPKPFPISAFGLILGNRRLAGSAIGGIAQTQEMLDYCAAHAITSDIEVIQMQQINEAYERMLKSDVRYRFVIDIASLRR